MPEGAPNKTSSEGFGAGPAGMPKASPGPGIFDPGYTGEYAQETTPQEGNQNPPAPATSPTPSIPQPTHDKPLAGLADRLASVSDRGREHAFNPFEAARQARQQQETAPIQTPTEEFESDEEESESTFPPSTLTAPAVAGKTQPFTLVANGQRRTIQIPSQFDLTDPAMVKELKDLYSARIAVEETKQSSPFQSFAEMKDAALKGVKLGLDHAKGATEAEAIRQGEKKEKSYRMVLPSLLQKKFDRAVDDEDWETIAELEQIAKMRLENEHLRKESEQFKEEFTKYVSGTEDDRAVLQTLKKIKNLAPNLSGDLDDPHSFIKELMDPNGGYFDYLVNKMNINSYAFTDSRFPHSQWLRIYAEETNTDLGLNSNGVPKGKTSKKSAGTQTQSNRTTASAAEVRELIGGGAQGSPISGNDSEQHLIKYHDAPLPVKREMEKQIPGIRKEYQTWFRRQELSGAVSPFGIKYK